MATMTSTPPGPTAGAATAAAPPRRATLLSLPNQLTLARFVLAVVLFGLIEARWWVACLVVFGLAAVTDWLDGYLARWQNLTSDIGRNLDPLVDKVLMCGAYIFLLPLGREQGWLQAWMVTVVVGRELVITGVRSFLENQAVRFGADWLGKFKMGLQCAALIAVFVTLERTDWLGPLAPWCPWLRDGLIYSMLGVTILSGAQYLWRAVWILRTANV
jgi:CDP-diacylglycerol---glycerol-3-phosphate 3-phosphatidyltransferase